IAANEFGMGVLKEQAQAPTMLLLIAGLIMVFTLWTSEKARRVIKTEVNLSRQDEGKERFRANILSQQIVRFVITVNRGINYILPDFFKKSIEKRFTKPREEVVVKTADAPAFDMVR